MKHNAYKRISSFLLALVMVMCMVPATVLTVFAADAIKPEVNGETAEISNLPSITPVC